ncbi:MAG: peptidase [Gracilimonas sp.]|uniref:M14 family metallopeptidase n=1 Tax=Gracilimonas sp. TaxID=1974203 RepID=UPI001999F407|nr:M14 family metallopeptidase [Gracilimonas sp.]MBD3617766.1 peptidase [Gracilimonas sp.]
MKNKILRSGLMVLIWTFGLMNLLSAQDLYSNFNDLTNRLNQLTSGYEDLSSLQSLAKTTDGRDIWVLTIGSGDVENHPAVAVIGGVKGSHIYGSELAIAFAEKLLRDSSSDEIRELLETTTFYVLPRINPDATEQYFANLKYERDVNTVSTNDDRDDAFDEDPFEDLNGDNLITMMRVADETGKWMIMPEDNRLVRKADISKGEKGGYHVFTEGIDNDKDGQFNEDGEGGVNINKNFTYDYPYFTPGAGENMASQIETRAVLDFLYEETPNVFSVVSFGPANNLSSPVKFNRGAISQRVIKGWYEEDVAVNSLVSEAYNDITKLKDAPAVSGQPGDLFQWAYFHYGRYSFSTPGWAVPDVMDEDEKPVKFDSNEAKFLAWADQNNLDAFVDWQEVDHPDFPGKTVEVGGIKPFVSDNPPYEYVDSLSRSHTDFLIRLAGMKPDIRLVNFDTEEAGRNLTRITVDVYNAGTLPTASRLGERTNWVKEAVVKIDLSNNLQLVSGDALETIESIEGDGTLKKSWLVRGSGSFTISAGAPNTGISTIEQTIR